MEATRRSSSVTRGLELESRTQLSSTIYHHGSPRLRDLVKTTDFSVDTMQNLNPKWVTNRVCKDLQALQALTVNLPKWFTRAVLDLGSMVKVAFPITFDVIRAAFHRNRPKTPLPHTPLPAAVPVLPSQSLHSPPAQLARPGPVHHQAPETEGGRRRRTAPHGWLLEHWDATSWNMWCPDTDMSNWARWF